MPSHREVPDGGWGWVVVASCFMLQALSQAVTFTFGIVMVALQKEFKSTDSETAWVASIQAFFVYFTGLVSGPLIIKYGWAKVTVVGSLLSAIGLYASSFTPNVYVLYITYSAINGFGNGLMYVTSNTSVQYYFNKRRGLAVGLAFSGSGFGILWFGYITQLLIDTYGWRYTLQIESLILCIGIPCGLALRPLPLIEDTPELSAPSSRTDSELVEVEQDRNRTTSNTSQSGYTKNGVSSLLINDEKSTKQGNSIEAKSYGSMTSHLESSSVQDEGSCCQLLDLSLFKNPIFVLFCLSLTAFCSNYHVPYTFTPKRAIAHGLSEKQAAFLVSLMGIVNVAARFPCAFMGDMNSTFRFVMVGVCIIGGGVISLLITWMTTHTAMILYCSLFGFFSGCFATLYSLVLTDLLGLAVLERSLGQAFAFASLAFLIASPLAGVIADNTEEWLGVLSLDAPFWFVGAIEILGGICFFLILPLKRYKQYYEPGPILKEYSENNQNNQNDDTGLGVPIVHNLEPLSNSYGRSRLGSSFLAQSLGRSGVHL